MDFKKTFKNKKILITGHTGFKGSWLTVWLLQLDAKVFGISDRIPTNPSNYEIIKKNKNLKSKFIDITNLSLIKKIIKKYQPDFIFHLAAQALVKNSYDNPTRTFLSNIIGTMNILEALKNYNKKCSVVLITSDKSYKNLEIKRGYKENDILGGYDPYSASKASAEIIIQSYINSFFKNKKNKVFIGIARAGNVIGGGDWAENRLIPDCVKSWSKKQKVTIRNPEATRPWQHVFEAIRGYLTLAKKIKQNKHLHGEAFNFGPSHKKNYNVNDVIKIFKKKWSNASWKIRRKKIFYESSLLKLNCSKAKKKLNYKSIMSFYQTISFTAEWYRNFYLKKINMYKFSVNQISKYENLVLKKK